MLAIILISSFSRFWKVASGHKSDICRQPCELERRRCGSRAAERQNASAPLARWSRMVALTSVSHNVDDIFPILLQCSAPFHPTSANRPRRTCVPRLPQIFPKKLETMNAESTGEVLDVVKRFRIVSVGGAGAGKSSLINCVFQVDDTKVQAQVSDFEPGDANIHQEITSETNPLFVLHDSKGFEPTDLSTFNVVRDFLLKKSDDDLELKERLHAVWLCIRTPIAGARVVETADEAFLKLAHERKIPVVIVFTQYDLLVRKFTEDSENAAKVEFDRSVKSLENAVARLNIDMPPYINVAVPKKKRLGINISELVDMTRKTVERHLQDVWIMWATAQRVNTSLKIEVSIDKGMAYFWHALSGTIPIAGSNLLRDCLFKVHRDIIACWNFKDANTVLNGEEFKHLMLSVVQEMQEEGPIKSSPPDIEKINNFITLCTAASAAVAPPVAILGLTYLFVSWMLESPLQNVPNVQRVLIAYTVDLILVLEQLFDITLQFKLMGTVSWKELRDAFEAYYNSTSQHDIHKQVRSLVERRQQLSSDLVGVRKNVEELVKKYSHSM
ncbi:hypothetical protein MVEN_01693800 [Mycena venus]|uniref:G domain-containing protein n=1 Tax=Mycena venus TaxID=2733690 RepID=A0A8H6XLV0_9AGAR|nr:hypothetical protein MVEN_01693800 [Mycena venus]